LYTGFISNDSKKHSFLNKLVGYGFIVHSKKAKNIRTREGISFRKSNLDVEIAIDAYRFSHNYDTIILFSGDSDFAYLIDRLTEKGKKIIVVSNEGHISTELLQRAKFIDLKKLRTSIEYI
jgi:uncharacterized LabA/DUF88 family protein